MENNKTEKKSDSLYAPNSPHGTLRDLISVFGITIYQFIDYDCDYVLRLLKDCENSSSEEKLEEYAIIWSSLENDINEAIWEIQDLYDSRIINNKDKIIINIFSDPLLKKTVLEGIAITDLILDKAKEAIQLFYDYSGYTCAPVYKYNDAHFTIENGILEGPITLEKYIDAFEQISRFLKDLNKGRYLYELDKISSMLILCMEHFSDYFDIKDHPTSMPSLQGNMTLLKFMQIYCIKQPFRVLQYRRKVLNDAHCRSAITLPDHTGKWKSGMKKHYRIRDLVQNWPDYCDQLPNLPKLKTEFQKATEKATQSN